MPLPGAGQADDGQLAALAVEAVPVPGGVKEEGVCDTQLLRVPQRCQECLCHR